MIKQHFAGHDKHSYTLAPFFYVNGMPNQLFSPMWQRSGQECRLFCFFPWRRWKDGRVKGTQGGAVLELALLTLHLHALSLIHCLPPSLILSLSVSFPSSHILLSSSTYFLGGGGGCRYTTRGSVWEIQSKTGTDSPRCTDHSGGLLPLSSPLCCSLNLHLKFVLCPCWDPLMPPHQLSYAVRLLFLNTVHAHAHTHTCKHMNTLTLVHVLDSHY